MGITDMAVLAFIAAWFFGAAAYLIRKKKNGGCIGCSGGGCVNCPKEKKLKEIKGKNCNREKFFVK